MEILLLGTGGADGIPALYGDDRVSQNARKVKGKEIRSRSAALVDGVLKIDLGPDTASQMIRENKSARDWSALLFTHSDDDHLCLSEIQYGLFPFVEETHLNYTIYANRVVCDIISKRYPEWPMDLVEIRKFEPFQHEQYRITPILAMHKDDEDCFNFIIEKEGKSFLYATDTGLMHQETLDFLVGKQIDLLVIECSDGHHKTPYMGHMDIAQCVELVGQLRDCLAITTEAPVYTTHHTAGGDATHAELIEILAPYRITPGFDGLQVSI
jgi:phosphoribosyl 1,2-cyclic phosphate phosphodiesterase